MATRSDPPRGSRGLSVRQLTLVFLGAVGVCALFFALGYLVGVNGRPAATDLATEQVPPPSEIPPTVNPPAQSNSLPETRTQSSVIEQNIEPTSASPASNPSQPSRIQEAPARPQNAQPVPEVSGGQAPAKGIMIQVAASHTAGSASQLVKALRAEGYHSVLVTPQEAGFNDHIYRVQVGPYESRPQAIAAMHTLSQKGFHPFIKE